MNVGIVGQGFVGSAIYRTLSQFYDIKTYDIDPEKGNTSLEDLIKNSNIVFFCVPTPMRKDGSCDTRILDSAISDAYNLVKHSIHELKHSGFLNKLERKKTFVIKSTVPPGTTEKLSEKYKLVNLCFSPEFLTEANSYKDFEKQSRIIVGGDGARLIKQMFRKAFPSIPIVVTTSITAEMVKYFTNCFLATKVIFANQFHEICENSGIDYDKVCEYSLYDERIGNSHLAVPGPDGDFGFGGHCFPKDLAAMIYFAKEVKVKPDLLESVQEANENYRISRDWEHMPGRAVSDD